MKISKSLRTKLTLLAVVPALFSASIGVLVFQSFSRASMSISAANEVQIPLTQESANMQTYLDQILQGLLIVAQSDADALSIDDIKKISLSLKSFEDSREKYLKLPHSAKESELYKSVAENWEGVKGIVTAVIGKAEKIDFKGKEAREAFLVQIKPALGPITASFAAISQSLEAGSVSRQVEIHTAGEAAVKSMAQSKNMLTLMISFLVVALLIGGLSIALPAHRALSGISLEVAKSSQELALTSGQFSRVGDQLANGASGSAAAIEETSALLEQIVNSMNKNAKTATQATTASKESRTVAENGALQIGKLIESISRMHESSGKVTEVVSIIEDISFQINLLSLNAAVEAARAGEQGKGFAVVAEAVRTLAGKSSDASKSIGKLIQETVQNINESTKVAALSSDSLKKILNGMVNVNNHIENITASSVEQASQIKRVNISIATLDSAVQENAAMAEESAASAKALDSNAESMSETARRLEEMVGSDKRHSRAA
jgi:methyl-accepting chemotaxis protein